MNNIEQNRINTVNAINRSAILIAWEVGAFVSDRIRNAKWGTKVVNNLLNIYTSRIQHSKVGVRFLFTEWLSFMKYILTTDLPNL